MDLTETVHMLRWLSSIDPRVVFNEASAEMWQHSLEPVTAAEAKQAVLDHYRQNDQFPATYAGIRKRALNIRDMQAAQHRALEATPSGTTVYNPRAMRSRNPELWDQLFEEGRRQGNETRAINGAQYGVKATSPEAQNGELTQFNMPEYTDWADQTEAA